MSSLPTTTVKDKDSTDENEKKTRLDQRDFINDLLKNYSIEHLDVKICKTDKSMREKQLFSLIFLGTFS